MGLIAQAKADIEKITGNLNDFAKVMTFVSPTPPGQTAIVNGLHSKHHLGVDTDGNEVNSQNAHISVSEKALTDEGYTVRNADGEVALTDHKVTVRDSTDVDKTYVIREAFPNETIGLIVCILGNYE